MSHDISQPIPQGSIGAQDAENRRVGAIANELRRLCQLYETQRGDSQQDVSSIETEQRVAEVFAKEHGLWGLNTKKRPSWQRRWHIRGGRWDKEERIASCLLDKQRAGSRGRRMSARVPVLVIWIKDPVLFILLGFTVGYQFLFPYRRMKNIFPSVRRKCIGAYHCLCL